MIDRSTSPSFETWSNDLTVWPFTAKAMAVASPPRPAPATMMFKGTFAETTPSAAASVECCGTRSRNLKLRVGYDFVAICQKAREIGLDGSLDLPSAS